MTFMHPWALVIAGLAAGLPLAIHLLTRPRPVRFPLSTLRFVREAIQQRRARHRLRDWLVLLLRTLAILFIGLAIARPQMGQSRLAGGQSDGEAVRVVLLDVSQSMGAIDGGVQIIDRAKTLAAEHLRYQPGLRANLVLAAARPTAVFAQASTNFAELRDRLGACQVTSEALNIRKSLELAAKLLAPRSESDDRPRELVVVSDFQRANWATADFGMLPEGTKIQLESLAPKTPLANYAVLRAACRGRAAKGGTAIIEVDVGNFSPSERTIAVEVTFGTSTYRLSGTCSAKTVTTLVQEAAVDATGWQWGSARLIGLDDALAADDRAPLVVDVREKPLYAILTRQSPRLRPSSSHFIECALVPDARREERATARVVRLRPNNLSREQIAPADLIVIDHPGKLSPDAVQLLSGLLRRGWPVIYVAAEAIDATNLERLREATGRAWQTPVEFSPAPAGKKRQGLFLVSLNSEQAPFRVFGDTASAAYADVRFAGGLVTRRDKHGASDDVMAEFNDGTAFLTLSATGAGSMAILNADLAISNLPATSSFVPLIEELVQEMLGRGGRGQRQVCGEPFRLPLPGDITSTNGLQIVFEQANPDNQSENIDATAGDSYGQLDEDADGVAWDWNAPARPGVYRIVRGDQSVFATSVQLSADESRLDTLPPDVLTDRLAGGRSVVYHSAADGDSQDDDFWKWLVTGCLLCLIAEIATLAWFRT